MQEQAGAGNWAKILRKLVTFLGAIALILVVLSWLRCGSGISGKSASHRTVPASSDRR